MLKKISNFITLFVLLSFFFTVGFGLSHSFGMELRDDGTMGGCLFGGKAEICTMSFSHHLSSWQGVFAATAPEKINILTLLALIGALLIAAIILRQNIASIVNYHAHRWKLYIKQNSYLSIFNPLQEAFSQGILNPKIYSAAN